MKLRIIVITVFTVAFAVFSFASDKDKDGKMPGGYVFEDVIVLPATSVKDQFQTGTCWSFAGLSLLESEMLRLGKPEIDLSEMIVVWYTYVEKAKRFVRLHGELSFTAGGAFHDVTNVISEYGIVPESVYSGMKEGQLKHTHSELDNLLASQVKEIVKDKKSKQYNLSIETVKETLGSHLGNVPGSFEFEGKIYSPQSFASDFIGLNMADYLHITSYTHHPFYSSFALEVPDNWSWDDVYNVPLKELEEIIDYSLDNGFTLAWASDVSEKGFVTNSKGVAVLPVAPPGELNEEELKKWEAMNDEERKRELYKLNKILDARREWLQLTETLSTRQKLAAARLAQQWDWHDRAIVTMGQTDYRDDIALRFPMPLKEMVEHYSEKQQIDPALTYAVIRRESAFMADARSSVGALGLMQIMPGTAKRVARFMNLPYGGKYSLLSADTNLNLGTSYLSQMLKRLDSQPVLATAAYNAGPNRVLDWLPQNEPLEAVRWIETIPFTETREYVSNVLTYAVIYQHRMAQAYTRLTQNMPPVQPRNSQTQTAALQKTAPKHGS